MINNYSFGTIEQYDQRDFRIWNDIIEDTPSKFVDKQIQYNQDLVHKNSCFLHWPCGAISDLTWYKFTTEQLQDMIEFCYLQKWANPEWGWYFNEAVKYVSKYVNTHILKWEQKAIYYRIPYTQYNDILSKWHSIITWFNVRSGWRNDKEDDWILNNSTWEYGTIFNWHCIRISSIGNRISVIDNYLNRKGYRNIYEIDDLNKQVEEWTFFTNWYIFCLKENVVDWYEGMTVKQKISKLKNRWL